MSNRTFLAPRPPSSPPAVWAAFAAQGRWKSWVMAGQLFVLVLLVFASVKVARTEPDVVLVEPDGRGTYVRRGVAGDALLQFLATQRQQPSDPEVVHFTREFLQLALAVHSSTIHEAWPAALEMMDPSLRAKWLKEAARRQLVEGIRLAQVRTTIAFQDISLVQRTEGLIHVRVELERVKSRLSDGQGDSRDSLEAQLVARVVPRRIERPAGLEVVEWTVQARVGTSQPLPSSPAASGVVR